MVSKLINIYSKSYGFDHVQKNYNYFYDKAVEELPFYREQFEKEEDENTKEISPIKDGIKCIISGHTPQRALELFKIMSEDIGELISIKQCQTSDFVSYETQFVFAEGTITVRNAFASGYSGSGPNKLINALMHLGIDAKLATEQVVNLKDSDCPYNFRLV